MHGYTNHRGPQHASVKQIPRLKNLQNRAVGFIRGFRAVHGLMLMRIKRLANRLNSFHAQLGQIIQHLLVNQRRFAKTSYVSQQQRKGKHPLTNLLRQGPD